jgi:eukaryotic-like serine/threonine-protein kinase
MSSSNIPAVGSRLLEGGRLRVVRELGRGSMGVVLEVWDERSGSPAALKIMSMPEDPELRLRFLREAKAAQKLTSPHALRVFEVGELDDRAKTPFMLTEMLEGMSLGDLLAKAKSIASSPSAIMKWTREALHALGEAHALGLVHRDLKPDNLFVVAATNTVKVIDFGIVKDTAATQSLTKTGEGFGSPAYMSPEQVHGKKEIDGRADIWSLGVTMFELLTGGRVPFNQDSVSNVFWAVLNTTAPRVREFRADVPLSLDAIVARCLERDPNLRYANAEELDRALADLEQTMTDPVEPPPTERDSPPVSGAVTMMELPAVGGAAAGAARRKKPKRAARSNNHNKRRQKRLTVVYVASLFAVLGVGGLALVGLLGFRKARMETTTRNPEQPVIVTLPPLPSSTESEDASSPPPVSSAVVVAPGPSSSRSLTRGHTPPPSPTATPLLGDRVVHTSSTGEANIIHIAHVPKPSDIDGVDVDTTGFFETVKECIGVTTGCSSAVFEIAFSNHRAPSATRLTDLKCDAVGQCIVRKNLDRRIKRCEPQTGNREGGALWMTTGLCSRFYQVQIDVSLTRQQ